MVNAQPHAAALAASSHFVFDAAFGPGSSMTNVWANVANDSDTDMPSGEAEPTANAAESGRSEAIAEGATCPPDAAPFNDNDSDPFYAAGGNVFALHGFPAAENVFAEMLVADGVGRDVEEDAQADVPPEGEEEQQCERRDNECDAKGDGPGEHGPEAPLSSSYSSVV
jgi:hypothetical protein